eukprot:gene10867-14585_t
MEENTQPLLSSPGSMNNTIPNNIAQLAAVNNNATGVIKNQNFLAQLETMMTAVKKEASALEGMKTKLREMEELRIRHAELKSKYSQMEQENNDMKRNLKDSELQNVELRSDMQRLNDIYSVERLNYLECQQLCMKLEQDLSGLRHEKEFFLRESQKMVDLKKANKVMKGQLNQNKINFDEEREQTQIKFNEYDKKIRLAEKLKDEATQHFWNLTEELKQSKNELINNQQQIKSLKEKLDDNKNSFLLYRNRACMIMEDPLILPYFNNTHKKKTEIMNEQNKQALKNIQNELQKTQHNLTNKTEEYNALLYKFNTIETNSKNEIKIYENKISSLQDSIKEFSQINQQLIQDNHVLKHKVNTIDNNSEKYITEIDQLKATLSHMEIAYEQNETELSNNLKITINTRDDLQFKLQAITAQYESCSLQLKNEQSKYFSELQVLKDNEVILMEESEKLSQELHEKTIKLHESETEKASKLESLNFDVNEANKVTTALKQELEKRLQELIIIKKEKDQFYEKMNEFESLNKSLQEQLHKNEATFKKTIDSDRNKLKQEMMSRMSRIKTLEGEKQELLNETNNLMKQIEKAQRDTIKTKNDNDEMNSQIKSLTDQTESLKSRNRELIEELKVSTRNEQELRDRAFQLENTGKEKLNKMEQMVIESKKATSHQTIELSNQIKAMYEELEEFKKYKLISMDLQLEIERGHSLLENTKKIHEDGVSQYEKELSNLRKELQDNRNKMKLNLESKTKIEMELINLRNVTNRLENDLNRQIENNRNNDQNIIQLTEKLKSSQATIELVSDTNNKLKQKIIDCEDMIQKKNNIIERLNQDMDHIERDGLVEVRRLRLQLSSAESELIELRSSIPNMQKELTEAKGNFMKLQNASSSNVTNLLEELKSTEDALSKERKKNQSLIDDHHSKVVDLQSQLDRSKESMDEMESKIKMINTDRDLKAVQLESELDRLKSTIPPKDNRIDELEKQHQQDRVKMHELKEKVDRIERELIESKSNLEMEITQKKRLEANIKLLNESNDVNHNNNGGYLSSRILTSRQGQGVERGERLYSASRMKNNNNNNNSSNNRQYASDYDETSGIFRDDDDSSARIHSRNYDSESYYGDSVSSVVDRERDRNDNYNDNKRLNSDQTMMRNSSSVPILRMNRTIDVDNNDNIDSYGVNSSYNYNNPYSNPPKSPSGSTIANDYYNISTNAPLSPSSSSSQTAMLSNNYNNSSQSQSSPIVDRISIALAARAAAESSKNSLKQVMQQRSGLLASTNRPNPSTRPLSSTSSPVITGSDYSEETAGLSAVEDTILRTQRVLNQRLARDRGAVGGNSSGGVGSDRGNIDNNPQNNRSSSRLVENISESIQHGQVLYPSSSHNMNNDDDNHNELASSLIDFPAVRPITPSDSKKDIAFMDYNSLLNDEQFIHNTNNDVDESFEDDNIHSNKGMPGNNSSVGLGSSKKRMTSANGTKKKKINNNKGGTSVVAQVNDPSTPLPPIQSGIVKGKSKG